jgi:hypothetical protein
MGPFCDRQRRGCRAGWFCLALVACLAPPAALRAAPADGVYYTKKRTFLIPYQTDGNEQRVKRVLLHMSDDDGRTYRKYAEAGPNDRYFRITALQDGRFWFAVQTQDTTGLLHPPSLDLIQPSLKVCVDTRPPTVALRSATPTTANAAIEWDVRDDNAGVDVTSLRVEYTSPGARDPIPLPAPQLAMGYYQWNLSGPGPVTVRLTVRDKAGNAAEQTITLTPGGTSPYPGTGTGTYENRNPDVTIVKSKTVTLSYQLTDVGESKVKSIEIYWLKGASQDWEKFKADESPTQQGDLYTVQVTVPEQGRYGFKLIAHSGADLSEPAPKRGDRPDLWVEVDTEPPEVKVGKLEMGKGPMHGRLTIRWTATDKHMAARPIRLSYSDETKAQWTVFAENLANDGVYVWDITTARDKLPFKVYVKVEAVDQAGNTGSAVSTELVPTDLSIPRAKILRAADGPGVSNVQVSQP